MSLYRIRSGVFREGRLDGSGGSRVSCRSALRIQCTGCGWTAAVSGQEECHSLLSAVSMGRRASGREGQCPHSSRTLVMQGEGPPDRSRKKSVHHQASWQCRLDSRKDPVGSPFQAFAFFLSTTAVGAGGTSCTLLRIGR